MPFETQWPPFQPPLQRLNAVTNNRPKIAALRQKGSFNNILCPMKLLVFSHSPSPKTYLSKGGIIPILISSLGNSSARENHCTINWQKRLNKQILCLFFRIILNLLLTFLASATPSPPIWPHPLTPSLLTNHHVTRRNYILYSSRDEIRRQSNQKTRIEIKFQRAGITISRFLIYTSLCIDNVSHAVFL